MQVNISETMMASMIKAIYETTHFIDANIIPEQVYMDIVENLKGFLLTWDYNKCPLEDWIENNLIIAPEPAMEGIDLSVYDFIVKTPDAGINNIISVGRIP